MHAVYATACLYIHVVVSLFPRSAGYLCFLCTRSHFRFSAAEEKYGSLVADTRIAATKMMNQTSNRCTKRNENVSKQRRRTFSTV